MTKTKPLLRSTTEIVRDFLDQTVLCDAPDTPMVGIGPLGLGYQSHRWPALVFRPRQRRCQRAVPPRLPLKIAIDDRELAEQTRLATLLELATRRGIVILDFDDEVRFATFCADTWPSERTRNLHAAIKADYASR